MNDDQAVELTELINKHRARGILVDTNLLIMLVVGSVNKDRISNFKRTGNYTIADYELLISFIDNFDKIITTPHVLSQTSDLTVLSGKEFGSARYSRS